eukprot:scaffold2288_cov87-Cylindrotheca_fusiformis.AAC.7
MSQKQQGQPENRHMLPPHHTRPATSKTKVVRFDNIIYQVPPVYHVNGGDAEDEFKGKNEKIHDVLLPPPSRYHDDDECYLDGKRSNRWSNDGSRSPKNDASPPMYPKRRDSPRSVSPSRQTNPTTLDNNNNRSQDGRMERDERGQYRNHSMMILPFLDREETK